MTKAQTKKFYFPAWTAAVQANGWHMEQCRLQLDESRLGVEGRAVVNFARQRAARDHRGITLDDLRHGAHLYALGRDISSSKLENREVDRVVTLFRLLARPDNLKARIAWDSPELAERDGLARYVATLAPEAVILAISRNAWDTAQWEDRNVSDLRWLVRTLKDRHERKASREVREEEERIPF